MTTICGVAAATFKDPTPENVRAKKLTFVCDLCVSVMVFQLFFFSFGTPELFERNMKRAFTVRRCRFSCCRHRCF